VRVLILDNYDSFTWNLVHGLEEAGGACTVRRSDAISVEEVAAFAPDRIVLSPGPFGPERAGICGAVVRAFGKRVPILGVCLGMQVIAAEFGAAVRPSGKPVHGRSSPVRHDERGLFTGVPNPFAAARYHSLVVEWLTPPAGVVITARLDDGTVMGCRTGLVEGVLFHPESFLTEHGQRLLGNFLDENYALVV